MATITLNNSHPDVTNSIRKIDTQKAIYQFNPISQILRMVVLVETYDSNDNLLSLYNEKYVITATNSSKIFKRNPSTGAAVYPYLIPENHSVSYIKEKLEVLDENGEIADWQRDEDGNYVVNPDFESAVQEWEYFQILEMQPVSNDTIKTNIINQLKNLNRFNK